MSDRPAAAEKTIKIEYLGMGGDPLVIPATKRRTWSKGDQGDEPEEVALELIEQSGFRRVTPPPPPEDKPKKTAPPSASSGT